jgi:hypothetical protein
MEQANNIFGFLYAALLGGAVLYCISRLSNGGAWKCDGCGEICDSDEQTTRSTDGHVYCDHCIDYQKGKNTSHHAAREYPKKRRV